MKIDARIIGVSAVQKARDLSWTFDILVMLVALFAGIVFNWLIQLPPSSNKNVAVVLFGVISLFFAVTYIYRSVQRKK